MPRLRATRAICCFTIARYAADLIDAIVKIRCAPYAILRQRVHDTMRGVPPFERRHDD